MKKTIYFILAALFLSTGLFAQSYFHENSNENFDRWVDIEDDEGNVVGERPYGWHAPYNSNWEVGSNLVGVKFVAVDDRDGAERSAVQIISSGIASTWFTWHIQVTPVHWPERDDYNPLFIDQGDDYFYTFWAKANTDEETVLWVGTQQNYDPNHGGLGWENMPNFTITNEWKQYGFVDFALVDITSFQIQLRENVDFMFDDIQLEYGYNLPDLGDYTGVFEIATQENPLTIISSKDGIALNSAISGNVSVYDTMGRQVVRDHFINEGNNFIPLTSKGLHILRVDNGAKPTSLKVVVQ